MTRKHQHYPWFHKGRKWPTDKNGELVFESPRRQHKLMTNVQVTPSILASAKKRRLLYMHAGERKRLGLNDCELRLELLEIAL